MLGIVIIFELEIPRNSSGGTLHLPFSTVGESAFVGRVSEHDICHLALTTTEVDSFNVPVVRCALFFWRGGRAERKGSIRIPKLLKLSPSTCWEWKKGESPKSWVSNGILNRQQFVTWKSLFLGSLGFFFQSFSGECHFQGRNLKDSIDPGWDLVLFRNFSLTKASRFLTGQWLYLPPSVTVLRPWLLEFPGFFGWRFCWVSWME